MKMKAVILTFSAGLLLFTVAGGLKVRASSNDGAYRQIQVYSEVLSRVRSEYVEEPNITNVTDGALHGLLDSLDPGFQLPDPGTIQTIQIRKDRHEGQHRGRRFQALRIRHGRFRNSGRSGRQSGLAGNRHFGSHRKQEHA